MPTAIAGIPVLDCTVVNHRCRDASISATIDAIEVVSPWMRRGVFFAPMIASMLFASSAFAEEQTVSVDLEKDTKPQTPAEAAAEANAPPPEAPPPPPYKKTLVLDSSIGAMAFFGQFGKVAPPGPYFRTQLGYELLKWLMFFAEGELSFTDTSVKEQPPRTRAFSIYGGGGGGRFTIRFGDRVGVYAQASFGLMKADVGKNALGVLGFKDAESLDTYLAGRLGFEWYQLDRHFALGITAAARLAQGFGITRVGTSDTPLIGDVGVSLRYAF
jgi:hypothetical protein